MEPNWLCLSVGSLLEVRQEKKNKTCKIMEINIMKTKSLPEKFAEVKTITVTP